ncbi:polysaccharide biosynthesis/export family protein [Neorhizobium sp. DAR64860/K0K1]|uniref:polysaccharide biosynthesis/export family protein n=1 Tax=Neorhizobium sp. DAR64860/K0K1 TaxID=3421955 RepID=UPI003D2CA700
MKFWISKASRNRKIASAHTVAPRHVSAKVGAVIAIASMIVAGFVTSSRADEYVLGPLDTLKVRVFEWRPSTGTTYEWTPLSGEFVVSAGGNLSLPIVGTIPAAGQTVEAVADAIGERLQKQVGLQKKPNASLEVAAYRPFFISGLVATPGKYSYSPGLTVLQALSMAGGLGPSDPNTLGIQRDALLSQGDLRSLDAERMALAARKARVDAILSDSETITFPTDLLARSENPLVAKMMEEENSLFETRRRSMDSELESLSQSKILAANQIKVLTAKSISLEKQIDMATKDLNSVNKLVSQGLTVSARQIGASQNLADLEARSLDTSLALVKTKQDLAKFDHDASEVRDKYRVDALTEASELRGRLALNTEKAQTTRAVLRNIANRSPAALAAIDNDGSPTFAISIDRHVGGVLRNLKVTDNDAIAPGDILRVERADAPLSSQLAEKAIQ